MRSKLRSSVTVKDILPSDKENAQIEACSKIALSILKRPKIFADNSLQTLYENS
jgi:hypothetical protein